MLKRTSISILLAALIVSCGDDKNNTPIPQTDAGDVSSDTTDMGDDSGGDPNAVGLEARPDNPDCVVGDPPETTLAIDITPAFPSLRLGLIVALHQLPGDNTEDWIAVDLRGALRRFSNDPAVRRSDVILNIVPKIEYSINLSELGGLFDVAIHPDWPNTPKMYVAYTTTDNGPLETVISEFTSNDGGDTLDESTEQVVFSVEQPYPGNNGGQLAFGNDGLLYIALGDGGGVGDPDKNGKNIDNPLGAILRVDVSSLPYSIPSDNPFANGGGAPEIYAWGFQNPRGLSIDKQTGDLWAGDPGAADREEVNQIRNGGNYGWADTEGSRCLDVIMCQTGPWLPPVADYPKSDSEGYVVGGYVYHGAAIPALQGTYLFGDLLSGKIYRAAYDINNKTYAEEILDTDLRIPNFTVDNDGEIYVWELNPSDIYKITDNGSSVANPMPTLLSATGCVDADDPTKPAAGLIPYAPNAPFWSDGAEKERWIAVPDGERIDVKASGDLEFPIGSVTVKNFILDDQLIETRLFVKHSDESWAGYSYEWNEAGSDATLLSARKVKDVNGTQWIYPSKADCTSCHTAASGGTLGLEIGQLNGDYDYPGGSVGNQVATLQHIKLFSTDPPSDPAKYPNPTGSADLNDRARAYLHTNCAFCHRTDNDLGRVKFDNTYSGLLSDLCNEEPTAGDAGFPGAKRLVPGDADASLLYQRMLLRNAHGMPGVGSTVVDTEGAGVIKEWIDGLNDCP